MSFGRRLASQSATIFAVRMVGAGMTFLAQAAIARHFGASVLGEYLVVMATVNIVAVVMPLGFETTGSYFAAEYRAKGEGRLLRGFLARAYGHVVLVALAIALFGYWLAPYAGEAGVALQSNWKSACVLALATGVIYVNSAILVGLKRPYAGYFAEGLFRPLVIIAALAITMIFLPHDTCISGMLKGMSVLYGGLAIGHFALVVQTARRVPTSQPARRGEWKRWWRFALPWVLIALASDYFFDIDLLVLSNLLPRDELAVFGVSTRIFSLVAFAVTAVYAVTLPDIFESEAKQDRAAFHRRLGDANLVASGVALVMFAAVAVGGPIALMLFGPRFSAGAVPLAVLCLSLVVRAVMGPATLVLSVHDRPYASLPAIGLGVVTLVAANLLLVPPLGLLGASLAALVAMTVWSGGLWLTVWLQVGIDISLLARLRRAPDGAVVAAR